MSSINASWLLSAFNYMIFIVVFVVGIVIALMHRSRWPKAMLLVTGGLGCGILAELVGLIQLVLLQLLDLGSLGVVLGVIGFFRLVLMLAAWVLVLWGALAGRQ
ncbi:MAG: hypothetical protein FJ125_16730 [Deltaproteobacteria bacterium]|nr:hypothetical protein [Deltaproteobacteria bacterium]